MRRLCARIAVCTGLALSLQAEETVLKTAPVPNRVLRQGDAHLITRDGAVGVRIDLHTRHLKRVRDNIIASEKDNWPGNASSERYQEGLQELTDELLEQERGKKRFQIDWFLHPDGTGTVRIGNDTLRKQFEDLSGEYLRKNLMLILADRFDLTPEQAEALLNTHLPSKD